MKLSLRHCPCQLMTKLAEGPAATYANSTNEQFASSEERMCAMYIAACVAVVVELSTCKQPRRLKLAVKGSDTTSKPDISAEGIRMHTSLVDVSGALSGTRKGTTGPHASVDKRSLPLASDATRHPFIRSIFGVRKHSGCLTGCKRGPLAGSLLSRRDPTYADALDGSQCVSCHTFSLTVIDS
jgi:hypothetical protein